MRKISLVDPGLSGYGGHHAELDFNIARELIVRGWEVKIFSHKTFVSKEPDIEVVPCFSVSPYNIMRSYHKGSGRSQSENLFDFGAQVFSRELKANVAIGDVLLMPTVWPCTLRGLSLSGLKVSRLVAIIHGPINSYNSDHGEFFWRTAFRGVESAAKELFIGILEGELFTDYESLLEVDGIKLQQFPIPHDGFESLETKRSQFTAGLFGQHGYKRPALIPEAVGIMRRNGIDVVIQDSSGVIKKSREDNGIRIYGYVSNFPKLISECDVTVLLYDQKHYKKNGSGVFWESVASGVPLVVPLGTAQSKYIGYCGNGLSFIPGNLESMAKKVNEIAANQCRFRVFADYARSAYRRRNSVSRFVDYIT